MYDQMEDERADAMDRESSEALRDRQRATREYEATRGAEQLQREVAEGRDAARSDARRRGQETRRTKQQELELAFEEGRGVEALEEQAAKPKTPRPKKGDPAEGQINLFTGEVEVTNEQDDSAAYEAALRRADGVAQAEARIEQRRQRMAELRNEAVEDRAAMIEGALKAISSQIENENLEMVQREAAKNELDALIEDIKEMDYESDVNPKTLSRLQILTPFQREMGGRLTDG